MMELVPLQEETPDLSDSVSLSFSPHVERPHENIVRRQPSATEDKDKSSH